jgi:predicted TIM-barrel fold metal-dependent hydrolase
MAGKRKVIDAHIHIHPFPTETNGVKMPPAYEQGLRADLEYLSIPIDQQAEVAVQRMDAAGVEAAIVVNPKHPYESGHVRTNESVFEAIKPFKGRLYSLAGIHVRPKPDIAELELAIEKFGFKGLKLLAGQQARPNDFDVMDPVYKKLQEYGLPIVWHPGPSHFAQPKGFGHDMGDYYEAAVRFPEVNMVIAHAGHGARGGSELACTVASACRNVWIEMSATIHSTAIPFMPPGAPRSGRMLSSFARNILNPEGGKISSQFQPVWDQIKEAHLQEIRGLWNRAPGKMIYGTDLPLTDRWDVTIPLFEEALKSDELLDLVMYGTAKRLYKLD